jgi:hypothetical protein
VRRVTRFDEGRHIANRPPIASAFPFGSHPLRALLHRRSARTVVAPLNTTDLNLCAIGSVPHLNSEDPSHVTVLLPGTSNRYTKSQSRKRNSLKTQLKLNF